MTYSITLQPSERHFQVEPGESILEAGLRQGIGLPHGCGNGACGSCKARIASGNIDLGSPEEHALPEGERVEGFALLCCATVRSDLVIECAEIGGGSDFPVKTLPARIQEMTRFASDVMRLKLKVPANDALRFRAGQYIDILLKNGSRRSFSIANAPHDDALIELHLRHVPGGLFTDQVFSGMKERDILRFNGPHGSFFLREDSDKPMLLVAGGTGFAPIKSIIEHALHVGCQRPIHLYWGARTQPDLYLDELARSWAGTLAGFRYTPVLSASPSTDKWSGRNGLVHQAVLDDYTDLSEYQVYASGAPGMIDACRQAFCETRKLSSDSFFSDAFTYAAPAP